ncbi:M28 family metallopeptidase [Colwellia sp. 4_MG-2023]|uniref:M28 family metallopeptidase n=1 Tax=unclassified Colwellia TaxID=196834 RepID=UPI001C0A587B|nr:MULTISPECIES: M28 family metallopeptidase [unclassified Colwellia]MBU2924962.1 M28 family peptidase [Colwellia sp. C2M11]MDO6487734.1 M28 family metallopeptidase [Colwellia sp. 6_MG-2023]MDO6506861.1 M28 family metallopeptidase [Colwellia sp. 5_MG-2023]MDO6555764.1 M28 family metallopeptidase [Colwellia sp. 4_MG-2023]MDO6652805.1 M28 family metallopeptidase [Colwellia sp. 3_MG-2023]
MKKTIGLTLLVSAVISGCVTNNIATTNTAADVTASYNSINKEQLIEHIKVLSSDEFEGRAPSTKGEALTLDYLTKQLTAIGFQPGNGDSFLQEVPMVSIEASPDMTLSINGKDYQYGEEMVMGTSRISDFEQLKNSELVFVGYGVNAPEYNWNDYKGLDVKGKTVVILVNDPGFATQDPDLFNGNAMTYYGRWTYKYEEASRQGAEGAIIIHETAPASYGWSVVEHSWSGPQFGFVREDLNKGRVAVEGWINSEVATELFERAGLNFEQAKIEAAKGSYHVDMGDLSASVSVKNTVKQSVSYNFIATLPGSSTPDEHIIYTAHWDHLGKDESLVGDQVYNGAVDNASGTGALIEVAEAFAKLPVAPERSITIMAVTAEEQGLLGSKYYAANPVIPAAKTVANINMDALGVDGRSSDVSVYGLGQSELDNFLTVAAKKQGRTIAGDPRPAAGIYYRSDHFAFANIGIPALYAKTGKTPVDEATKALRAELSESLSKCYHNLCDEYSDAWDLSGAVEDMQAFFEVGYELSKENVWPQWSKTSEFKR